SFLSPSPSPSPSYPLSLHDALELALVSHTAQPSAPRKRPPRILAWVLGIIAVILFIGPLFVGVYTDWKWFGAIEYRGVFNIAIVARVVLFSVTAIIAAVVGWLAGFFVCRGRPDILDLGDLNSPVYQYRQAIEKSVGTFLKVLPLLIGLLTGF